MYLKSIEMQGFKSFPDRTKMIFDAGSADKKEGNNGVTVIVGPNGSGKSNIADAMRWVLGEISSKTLRGTKMEDVIFGGAASRRPMGFAEVSVTFDNTSDFGKLDCPYDEVTVTRRYFRAGESEYYINRKPVRLKDIYELFMNTGIGRDGYSIIGQGRIAEIVSKKSEERRSIFEEASGIAKFRHRKNEAERKLDGVDNNMSRAADIFAEVEAQLLPLEKESAKAVKAIEYMEKKKQIDVGLWLFDTERLRNEITAAETAVGRSRFDLQAAEDSLASLDVQHERLLETSQQSRSRNSRIAEDIRILTEKKYKLDTQFRVLESNIGHTNGTIQDIKNSKKDSDGQRIAAEEQLAEYAKRREELRLKNEDKLREFDSVSDEIDESREDSAKLSDEIGAALGDIKAAEHESTDIKVRISALESAKNSGSDRTGGILEDIEKYTDQVKGFDGQIASGKKTADGYSAEIDKIRADQSEAEAKLADLNEKFAAETENSNNRKLRRDSVAQRINTYKAMEENFDGYANAVKYVMNKYAEGAICDKFGNKCGKIYGPLSKVISVEDRFVTAAETALGANLQYIVVEDEATAQAAMFCLKSGDAGRTTFFPLTSMKPQSVTDEMKEASGFSGYVGIADSVVRCNREFSGVVSALLGRTLIFDNIQNATEMAKALRYRVRVVTLDGQQINPGGSFTGGSVKRDGGILSRAGEIRRLEGDLEELKKKAAESDKAVAALRDEIEETSDAVNSCVERASLIGVLLNTVNAQLEQYNAKSDAAKSLISKLKSDYDEIIRTSEKYDEDIDGLRRDAEMLEERIKAISQVRIEKDEQVAFINEKIRELEDRKTQILIDINGIEKDAETLRTLTGSAEERIRILNESDRSSDDRINILKETIKGYELEQQDNRRELELCNGELSDLESKREEIASDAEGYEKKLADLNDRIRLKYSEKDVIFKENTINENKLENLKRELDELSGRLWDDYSITREEAAALGYPAITPEGRTAAVQEQTEYRNKLRHLGNVDLDAAEKYKEVKKRYDEMSVQIKDLEKSRSELTDIISSLDTEMETSFAAAFAKINENFGKTFAELFGGGSAEISLADPEHVLDSGIEIKAAPPGKIIKNLMQLSGGEQAFVAIALFFAILQVNPAPFCILDEIEAALDEVNVERLAQYIKRYSDGTQFIMITHRRGTMAAANHLYGVTMPEHGISKVLQLDINDISKKEGDWDGIFG